MGKLTAVAYNAQVTAHHEECARVGAYMTEDDVLAHYLNSLSVSRYQEVLTAVNAKRSMIKEHYGDMARLNIFLNKQVPKENNDGEEFDYEEQKVTLEEVMALCVEVEERAALKTGAVDHSTSCRACSSWCLHD